MRALRHCWAWIKDHDATLWSICLLVGIVVYVKVGSPYPEHILSPAPESAVSSTLTAGPAPIAASPTYRPVPVVTRPPVVIYIPYHRPTPLPVVPANMAGATATCADGTVSYSANHRGTCSHHGGVIAWYR